MLLHGLPGPPGDLRGDPDRRRARRGHSREPSRHRSAARETWHHHAERFGPRSVPFRADVARGGTAAAQGVNTDHASIIHTPLILRIAFKQRPDTTRNLNATYEEPIPLFDSAGLDAVSSCRRVGADRRCEPYRCDPRPARHADPARRGLPRRGGSVGGRGSALRAAALGGPSGRCEPERARRGEPDGELQLHAGPHRRAVAVSVRAVRTGRAGHREYRLRLSVQSACRSAA